MGRYTRKRHRRKCECVACTEPPDTIPPPLCGPVPSDKMYDEGYMEKQLSDWSNDDAAWDRAFQKVQEKKQRTIRRRKCLTFI